MAETGEPIRFHHSARSLVVTSVVVFFALIPLGLAVGQLPGWAGGLSPDHLGVGLVFYVVLAIGLVLVGRATNTTRVDGATIRGTAPLGRRFRQPRPPSLDHIDSVTTRGVVLARVIVLEATDGHGETLRWRLDAPTALRWGRDRVFDQAYEQLKARWRECHAAPAEHT